MQPLTLLLTGTALSVSLATTLASAQTAGGPVATEPPNAPDKEPAFPEQTRAPQPAEMPEVTPEVVADGLPQLWAMEFLPDVV